MNVNIGGLQKFSLSDYPGKIAAIIFLRGCNFRCSYCHNKDLFDTQKQSMPITNIFEFLHKRKDQLNGVVITGGEPTLYIDLPIFLEKIKSLGYDIKLNTNGSYPDRLHQLIQNKLIDYIAMDIKAPLKKYSKITSQQKINIHSIQKSIALIIKSSILHEFRTTVTSELSKDDIQAIKTLIPSSSQHHINHAT